MFGQLEVFRNYEGRKLADKLLLYEPGFSCVINFSSRFLKVFTVASEIKVDTT
jgi:hypothetical protein